MRQFLKKTIWAALLTAAVTLTAAGCGEQSSNSSSVLDSPAEIDTASEAGQDTSERTESGEYTYEMTENGTVSITGYSGSETVLEVPASVDGYIVSSVAAHAFEANWDLTSVVLPSGLASIGESAFMDCGSLASVTIPDTVGQIDRAAFAGCSSLTSVVLPAAVSTVQEEAFTGCGSLTELTVANPALEYARWGIVEGAEPLNVTIICPAGSAIENWAAENGIATQPLA